MTRDKALSCGWHNTYGWLRVPHMDGFNTFAYEHPDGSIIESKDKAHKERIHLTAYEDSETGEKYVSPTRR
jgi:hypothetical protein